jgi:hypothetical protein
LPSKHILQIPQSAAQSGVEMDFEEGREIILPFQQFGLETGQMTNVFWGTDLHFSRVVSVQGPQCVRNDQMEFSVIR